MILGISNSTPWTLYQKGTFSALVIRIGKYICVVKVPIKQFLQTGEPVNFESATTSPVAFEPVARESNAG